jgi:hypothetical protein
VAILAVETQIGNGKNTLIRKVLQIGWVLRLAGEVVFMMSRSSFTKTTRGARLRRLRRDTQAMKRVAQGKGNGTNGTNGTDGARLRRLRRGPAGGEKK